MRLKNSNGYFFLTKLICVYFLMKPTNMRTIFAIIFLFVTTTIFAQYAITIDAYVLDIHSKQPIPYVNVQCIGKDIKAITDASGKFTLTFDEAFVNENDQFQFITHKYDSLTVKFQKLTKYLSVTNKIHLTSTTKIHLKIQLVELFLVGKMEPFRMLLFELKILFKKYKQQLMETSKFRQK